MNRSNASSRSFSTDQLRATLVDVGGPARPDYLPDIVAQAGRMRQRPAWTLLASWLSIDTAARRQGIRRAAVFAPLFLLVALLAAGVAFIGSQDVKPEPLRPATEFGIFAPVAGRIVYDRDGIRGVDPTAPADPPTTVQLTSEAGIPLGWSSDGTRLLILRPDPTDPAFPGPGHLFVLHADGSEMQVTERPMTIRGATISPDGSRVVFASGGLYVVDADGGPAEMLAGYRRGMVEEPTFSPDGTQIAYVDGAGDHSHSVWLMNADGSDAHQILANETTEGAGHAYGLAWSPGGDRIALGLEGATYTFATDGSGFTRVIARGDQPHWSPDGSEIAYTVCSEGPGGCGLAIADSDGSNVREFGFGASGPWHPGSLEERVEAPASPSPSDPRTASPSPVAPPPPLTERFDSTLNGISLNYPESWQTRPATQPSTDGDVSFDAPGAHIIFDPKLGEDPYLAVLSEPLEGRPDDVWKQTSGTSPTERARASARRFPRSARGRRTGCQTRSSARETPGRWPSAGRQAGTRRPPGSEIHAG
jgi:Tol biopolymer transport system component